MRSLGVNIGSSSIKAVLVEDGAAVWHGVRAHEGDFLQTLRSLLAGCPRDLAGTPALATGTEGRFLVRVPNVIEPLCVEEALAASGEAADAVVSMGGEDLVVYSLEAGRITGNFSGNKCASGTGEFFCQQLGRMDMDPSQVNSIPAGGRVLPISSRCSVFMKSDCTHRLNKGEATKEEIVLSLSAVMAGKVVDFLGKARVGSGRVLLIGGVAGNEHIVRFIRAALAEIAFVVPPQAAWFEAWGAALLAARIGAPLPAAEELTGANRVGFQRLPGLRQAAGRVRMLHSRKAAVQAGREYVLGVDGGSTTTKACLIDAETRQITASHYGRTHGDPVRALKRCLEELRRQVEEDTGGEPVTITLAAATGSSREILGVFLDTPAVYNEIIAHAVGTTYYEPEIDTIFEIGGQDAKYVLLKNMVPIDYAMNEACSAGTGSFLEESARGDLNISSAEEIGPVALAAESPLKFGEHCSAFINSDIRKAIQQGAGREDIAAGLVTSIVSNYLNRVVGNRTIGEKIVLQGGVAKNPAVPLAFAQLLEKVILVPPDPELMGCFGVGILALRRAREGLIHRSRYVLEELLGRDIVAVREFACRSCENYCPVRVLSVGGRRTMFGGRCSKYANLRLKENAGQARARDFVAERMELMFRHCAPDPQSFSPRRPFTVGVPRTFSVYTLWPFYAWFFHELGIRTVLSEEIAPGGLARTESTYCYPAELAHGAVQALIEQGVDYLFLPHLRDMPSYEKDVHARFCPIVQSLPYYIRKAFPELRADQVLAPVVSLEHGRERTLESFQRMGRALGISAQEVGRAFERAVARQEEYRRRARALGEEALQHARSSPLPVVAILGRPYNAFTTDANMGIPRKFASRGHSVVPFDILPFGEEAIFPNMYWYYGQQNMKTAALIREERNLYVTYVTNFSCAPDSFLLHYLKWTMGVKPFLVLELDSHTADAGIDTRVEAFLDIIEGYRSREGELASARYDNGLRFVNDGQEDIHIRNVHTGQKIPVRNNPRVKLLLANMGNLAAQMVARVTTSIGLQGEALPVADARTLQVARSHASGKECVPSHLVLGSALQYFGSQRYRKDHIYLVFVPMTTGPCRTGQYYVYFENLFRELRLENVLVFTLNADNSYNELGPHFSRHLWWALVVADTMKDVETSLRTCAADPQEAMRRHRELWQRLLEVAAGKITRAPAALRGIARQVRRIPLKRTLKGTPKVLIVGEIYVRRDDFAVDELVRLFSQKGIIGKASGISEWVHYLDFVREYDLKKRLRLLPWPARLFSPEQRQLLRLRLEMLYKRSVELRVRRALAATRLLPGMPDDMKAIMRTTEEHFLSHELNSEIAVSSGAAAAAMMDGYSGVVNIAPFACLIGRVVQGLFTPWARSRRYPTISVEVDGNLLPPATVSRLDIFMLNVLRFRQDPELAQLVDRPAL